MTRVTQRVDPERLHDLLEHAAGASIAFGDEGRVEAAPVAFRFETGRYWIGATRSGSASMPQPKGQVTLVVDDGWYWFQLRALCIRGVAVPAAQRPADASSALDWFEVIPKSVVAWDYATLREAE